ncbi:MAG: hypothetical protein IJN96_05370 [Clostridia bacterium]|nr:hypothetical protein [Clostridia bacterium]
MSTNIWLCLISLFLALFTVVISKSTKNKYTEILAIPVIVICSFILGNSDTHDTRVKTTAILIISYVIFYGIISLLYWGIIKLISRTGKTAEEQKNTRSYITIRL